MNAATGMTKRMMWIVVAAGLVACTAENPLFVEATAVGGDAVVGGDVDGGEVDASEGRMDAEKGKGDAEMVSVDGGVVAADMVVVPDMTPLPDLMPSCALDVVRGSCQEHLQAGCVKDGAYTVGVKGLGDVRVWCEMQDDGGGWALVYSNANNWADHNSSDVKSVWANQHVVYKWYDSSWGLVRSADPNRLGQPREGDTLTPTQISGMNAKAFYNAGWSSVRFDFVQGADKAVESGWCSTDGTWDFSAGQSRTFTCRGQGERGSGDLLCLSGKETCDQTQWNTGWTNSITLGNAKWNYAHQSAPNHLGPEQDHGGHDVGLMVAGWDQPDHTNTARNGNYQVRIWLR